MNARSAVMILALTTSLFAFNASAGSLRPLPIPACPSAPVIDGVFEPNEWSGAKAYSFDVALPEGGTTPATLYVKNDSRFLYTALVYDRTVADAAMSFGLELDANQDGAIDAGDDDFVVSFDSYGGLTTSDNFRFSNQSACPDGALCSGVDSDFGGTANLDAAYGNDGISVFEAAHPLRSGDAHDMAVVPGSTIGFVASLRLIAPGAEWPNGIADTFYPGPALSTLAQYTTLNCSN